MVVGAGVAAALTVQYWLDASSGKAVCTGISSRKTWDVNHITWDSPFKRHCIRIPIQLLSQWDWFVFGNLVLNNNSTVKSK